MTAGERAGAGCFWAWLGFSALVAMAGLVGLGFLGAALVGWLNRN